MNSGEVVAAIKFDAHAAAIIAAADAIAKKRGLLLRLVHIFSPDLPVQTFPTAVADTGDDGESSYAYYTGQTPLDIARERLEQLAPTGNVVCEVVVGEFPETLLAGAAHRNAALVVTGAAMRNPGFLRTKLRHTYKMMARTALPVLVLPDDASPFEIRDEPLRIIVADDLTEASRPALQATETLISLVGGKVEVLHLHVETPSPLSGEDRLALVRHERLLSKLRARAIPLASKVEAAGGTYRTQLWHGRVDDELSRAAEANRTDVTVFGQHRFLHREKSSFGQMPFKAMLNVGSAVLVAPPS